MELILPKVEVDNQRRITSKRNSHFILSIGRSARPDCTETKEEKPSPRLASNHPEFIFHSSKLHHHQSFQVEIYLQFQQEQEQERVGEEELFKTQD